MEYLKIQIDIIEEIRKLINDNIHFDVNKWCQYDANVLKRAARIIEEELLETDEELLETDAVKILHQRYVGDDPEREASLQEERDENKTLRTASGIGISKLLTWVINKKKQFKKGVKLWKNKQMSRDVNSNALSLKRILDKNLSF